MLSTAHSEPNLLFGNNNSVSDTCKGFKHSISINGNSLLSKSFNLFDEPDNNTKSSESASYSLSNGDLFETMKYEVNRLLSYENKWPCHYIKSEDLAEAGFFYLQVEDRVQCPFCRVIIHNWRIGDKPLREHMKRFPKCPFLMSVDVGNIPITRSNSPSGSKMSQPSVSPPSSSFEFTSYKPKHPKMADIKRRRLSFKEWPLVTIEANDLAECGLYYTGVADVVTCFFCGGSLGNWEVDDNPWEEHSKHFGQCLFLSLAKKDISKKSKTRETAEKMFESQDKSISQTASYDSRSSNRDIMSEIYIQACEIFPEPLVSEVFAKNKNRTYTSLSGICEEILRAKEEKDIKSKSSELLSLAAPETNLKAVEETVLSAVKTKNNAFMCKICMDHDMEVVFQPCGHFVSCQNCSRVIFDCPLCRKPITSKVRAYLS